MNYLTEEDYAEPRCPFCKPGAAASIPIGRVTEKLDALMAKKDTAGAERHLAYWLAEAQAAADVRGTLAVLNEWIGFCRKEEREKDAFRYCELALPLAEKEFPDTVTQATTLINAATAYKAFSRAAEALPLYEKARKIYETALAPDDGRLAGLYNNMALALTDEKQYAAAREAYMRALSVLEKCADTFPEQAITYCNLAALCEAETGLLDGEEAITAYMEKARRALDAPQTRDANYAYVCEKCADAFGYYGYFSYREDLEKREEDSYGGYKEQEDL